MAIHSVILMMSVVRASAIANISVIASLLVPIQIGGPSSRPGAATIWGGGLSSFGAATGKAAASLPVNLKCQRCPHLKRAAQ
jgi:hypothetical protein